LNGCWQVAIRFVSVSGWHHERQSGRTTVNAAVLPRLRVASRTPPGYGSRHKSCKKQKVVNHGGGKRLSLTYIFLDFGISSREHLGLRANPSWLHVRAANE
jgi:hypothetical protein